MEFEKMIELIKTVSDSNLTQFQIEEDGFKLSMKTDTTVQSSSSEAGKHTKRNSKCCDG